MPEGPVTPARDREAEIDSAIRSLTTASGPVSVRAVTDPGGQVGRRRIEFVYRRQVGRADDHWLPFQGNGGELSAAGPTLTVGLGPEAESSPESARRAARFAGMHLSGTEVEVNFPQTGQPHIDAIIDGLAGAYPKMDPVRLAVQPAHLRDATQGLLTADTVRLAQRLVNAPANLLTPERAALWAQDIAARAGLEYTVLGPDQLLALGFGALSAIGAGSVNGPQLVRLSHHGSGRGPVLSLVGKGVTFDSGGLSLKSPAAMQTMRLDVAGAATVLAVMGALARAGTSITVHAVLPFAENLPGAGAVRPGDVVTAWNGTQIQVLDSDFEGRVILADALALAAADKPALLIDFATLTHQAEIALGPEIAAVLSRDDGAAATLLRAASRSGEPMWRLPWAPRYLDQVRTPFGVRNHPLHDSGRALTAALFLGEFVPDSVAWAHCDMTGPAWSGDASMDGATGFGARTLLSLISELESTTT